MDTPPAPEQPQAGRPAPARPQVPPDPATYAYPIPEHAAPDATDVPARRGRRDPGSGPAANIAWVVVLLCVGVILTLHAVGDAAVEKAAPGIKPDVPMVLLGRYTVAVRDLTPEAAPQLIAQLDEYAKRPADKVRTAIVAGEVVGASDALTRLTKVEEDLRREEAKAAPASDEAPVDAKPDTAGTPAAKAGDKSTDPAAVRAELLQDVQTLRLIYTDGARAAPADAAEALVKHQEWFGKLALSYGLPTTDPARARVLADAKRLAFTLVGALGAGGFFIVVGFVLAIIAIVRRATGKLRTAYAPPARGGSVFVEAFALFLVGFIVIQLIGGAIQAVGGPDLTDLLIWILPLAALWPRLRGVDALSLRYALGWHRGKGVAREMGAGVVGYLSGLPVFLTGILITLLLIALDNLLRGDKGAVEPTHPIVNELGKGGFWGMMKIYLLASVWAPLTEETMFRGALYHHLRGRFGAIVSGLVVAFLFAVIHPQGYLAVPALMGLAVVLAGIREWRGSIIGSVTVHAIHNGIIMTLLFLALS